MTTENSVFDGLDRQPSAPVVEDTNPSAQETTQTNEQVIPEELREFIGEGKKYKSLGDIYKAFPNSQKHIQTLEEENKAIKAELEKRRTAEELLAEMRKDVAPKEETTSNVEFNKDVASEIVRKEMMAMKEAETQANNIALVNKAFEDSYGEKAQEAAKKLLEETGMSVKDMAALSARSPNAVLKLAGLSQGIPKKPTSTIGSVNTQHQSLQQEKSLSCKVGLYPSSKEIARAWAATREMINKS